MTDAKELVSAVAQADKEHIAKSSICRICSLDATQRRVIEELMACGVSNTMIIHIASNMFDIDLTGTVIAKHIDHLPAQMFIYKEIIERRAKEAGVTLDDTTNRMTPVAYIEMLLNDATKTLIEHPGSTNPYLGLQAAKTLQDIDSNKVSNETVMEWVTKFRQLTSAIKSVCSDEQIDKILKAVE